MDIKISPETRAAIDAQNLKLAKLHGEMREIAGQAAALRERLNEPARLEAELSAVNAAETADVCAWAKAGAAGSPPSRAKERTALAKRLAEMSEMPAMTQAAIAELEGEYAKIAQVAAAAQRDSDDLILAVARDGFEALLPTVEAEVAAANARIELLRGAADFLFAEAHTRSTFKKPAEKFFALANQVRDRIVPINTGATKSDPAFWRDAVNAALAPAE